MAKDTVLLSSILGEDFPVWMLWGLLCSCQQFLPQSVQLSPVISLVSQGKLWQDCILVCCYEEADMVMSTRETILMVGGQGCCVDYQPSSKRRNTVQKCRIWRKADGLKIPLACQTAPVETEHIASTTINQTTATQTTVIMSPKLPDLPSHDVGQIWHQAIRQIGRSRGIGKVAEL